MTVHSVAQDNQLIMTIRIINDIYDAPDLWRNRTELGTYSIKSITGQRWARTVSKVSQDRAGHVQYQKSASAHDTDTHAQTGISYSHRAKVCQRVKSRSFYEIFVFRA